MDPDINLGKSTLKSKFLSQLFKKALFGLLFIGYYLKNKTVIFFRFLFKNKIGLAAALIIFALIFSLTEVKPGQQNLLARAIAYREMVLSLNQNSPRLVSSAKKQEPSFHIASLQRENSGPGLTAEGMLVIPEKNLDPSKPLTRTTIETYNVQPGDNLYSIADKFGLRIDSLLWENKLTLRSIIRPGQALKILPVDGLSHKVKKGETLEAIAKKYKSAVDEIVEFNDLADASDIFVGDELIIPHGKKPYVPRRFVRRRTNRSYLYKRPSGKYCHNFVPGQCTWYVARRRCIPWTGNANTWLAHARRMGFKIGSWPQKGAVISLREVGWRARRYGHVGYVESFTNKTVTFSEMNFRGPWIRTTRTLPLNSPKIIGYIY